MFNQIDAAELARRSLESFDIALYAGFESAPHVRLLIRELEKVERGETRRLALFLPPRHSKSFNATQLFPAWVLGRHQLRPPDGRDS